MSELLDFTEEGKHTKYFDCYIKCGDHIFMFHRNALCIIDYFDSFFDEKFKADKLNSVPICTIPDKFSEYTNILLNIIYTKEININKHDIVEVINMFDYIGYHGIICDIINQISNIPYDDLDKIIKYIKGKEKILIKCDYSRIVSLFVNSCININIIESDTFDIEEFVDINHIDIKNISMMRNKKHIKIIEYMYKIKGEEMLLSFDINKVITRKPTNTFVNHDAWMYIIRMRKLNPVRNYLIVQYVILSKQIHPDNIDTNCFLKYLNK